MRVREEPVELEGRLVGPKTAKALLVEFTSDGEEKWLPYSQIEDQKGPYGYDMDLFTFTVSGWWAGKNGYGS